eukprot:1546626-Rhodomonas_salina.1
MHRKVGQEVPVAGHPCRRCYWPGTNSHCLSTEDPSTHNTLFQVPGSHLVRVPTRIPGTRIAIRICSFSYHHVTTAISTGA